MGYRYLKGLAACAADPGFLYLSSLFGWLWESFRHSISIFSELWGALGPSCIQLGAQRRILEIISEASMLEGCVWGAQGMDFDGKSRPGNSQSRQQSPKERPKGSQGSPKGETNHKKRKTAAP